MKLEIGEHGYFELQDVFNPITLLIGEHEFLTICMRDGAFEFTYNGTKYSARDSVIQELLGSKKIATEKPAAAIDQEVPFNPNAKRYTIEISTDGVRWRQQAEFTHGQKSRITGKPFDSQVVLREAFSFKEARGKEFPYVRVIIEV